MGDTHVESLKVGIDPGSPVTAVDSDGYLYQAGTKLVIETGRETFTNSGTAAADVTVNVTFSETFASAPKVVLGKECTQDARISTAATTSGFSITVASVPASTTVYVNWIAIGS